MMQREQVKPITKEELEARLLTLAVPKRQTSKFLKHTYTDGRYLRFQTDIASTIITTTNNFTASASVPRSAIFPGIPVHQHRVGNTSTPPQDSVASSTPVPGF